MEIGNKGFLITFQNVHGLWKDRCSDFEDAFRIMETIGTDYIGVTETHLNSRNKEEQRAKKEIMKTTMKQMTSQIKMIRWMIRLMMMRVRLFCMIHPKKLRTQL